MYNILERVSVLLFGFGSLYFLLRALTKDEFGTWVLFLTTVSFFEVARIGLLQNALVKYLTTSTPEDYPKINTASAVNNILLSIFNVALLLIIAYPLSLLWGPELFQLLLIYTITTIILIPFFQCNFIQQANLDFRGIFYGNFFKQGIFFLWVAYAYFSGWKIELIHLAMLQIATATIGAGVTWFFARPYLRFSKIIDWPWVKKLFNFGRYVFGTNLSAMMYKSIDKLMLGSLLSTGAVAMYELALRITNLAEVPSFSISNMVFPQSARQMASEGKESVKLLYEKSVGAILAMVVPFVLFTLLFPEFIITVIASEKYLDAVPILRLTILFGLFIPFAIQFGTVLDSIGRPKINFYFTLLGAFLNIIFNYIFITNFGVIGAAYGTLTSYGITFVIMQFVLAKELNVQILNTFKYGFLFYGEAYQMITDFLKKKFSEIKTKNA